MNIAEWSRFCQERFPMQEWLGRARDNRKRPEIAPRVVWKTVTEMVVLGQKSLLSVDQAGRLAQVRSWHGSRRRMVVSDSTMERSLSGFDREGLRANLRDVYRVLASRGELWRRLESGRRLRVGIVDGSEFGGIGACVVAVAGHVDVALDLATYTRGKELGAAEEVMDRMVKTHGRGFVDVLVADGLYVTRKFFQRSREEYGCEGVVKTKEKDLSVIQDAEGLFLLPPGPNDGIERVGGVDTERGVRYEIVAASGFEWEGVPFPLSVARVKETCLKPRPTEPVEEVFWVITSDASLSAEELRELAHLRWRIENNIFKRLSALVASKHCYTHKPEVREALLLMWFAALVLLGAYLLWWVQHGQREEGLQTMKFTWMCAVQMFWASLFGGSLALP